MRPSVLMHVYMPIRKKVSSLSAHLSFEHNLFVLSVNEHTLKVQKLSVDEEDLDVVLFKKTSAPKHTSMHTHKQMRLFVGRLVGLSVCHNFIKERKVIGALV